MITEFSIQIPEESQRLVERLSPLAALAAVAAGMDKATPEVLSRIQEERLTGQGPFPTEEHRLGVRSGQLRSAAYVTPATIRGNAVTSQIGTPVAYAAIHEYGGTFTRTSKPGKVRLRTDRKGQLLRRGNLATFARKTHSQVKEVSYEGGKTYTVTYPARAPFGFGLADHADIFTTEISRALAAQINGDAQP